MELLKFKKEAAIPKLGAKGSGKQLRLFVIKYFYPLISLLMLAALIILAAFLYYNVYLSLNHAQNVARLKKQVLEEEIMASNLTRIIVVLDQKNQDSQHGLETISNPFKRQWEIKK